ncbi:MAG: GNAT family N-acetyltransferase [Bacteroidetes bacterium]|nr:MAG: GNAT family N-acetyltransferase [Bacteroidota bacterium]
MSWIIRELRIEDNQAIALVIRKSLEEHGVARPGTVYTDPTTDDLFKLFQAKGSAYFVAEENGEILGGCGVYPTDGLPVGCAELVKLYVSSHARGKGIGQALMERSALAARELGYQQLYLETLPELAKAVSLYERSGYTNLDKPLGESGHFACTIWMIKDLK